MNFIDQTTAVKNGICGSKLDGSRTRLPRIVTVCVLGDRAKRSTINPRRYQLMKLVIEAIVSRKEWYPIDAVIFPGGHFFSTTCVGHHSYSERKSIIENDRTGEVCRWTARQLDKISPGAILVTGIDSVGRGPQDWGDQLCVAFNADGVAGIGRKIFPTNNESNGSIPPIVCYVDDFDTEHRIVTLANGSRSILASCYDAFGLAEPINGPTARTRYIRNINYEDRRISFGDPHFTKLRQSCLDRWDALLKAKPVDVALTTIHNFGEPGADLFWQRHGIATASAAMGGGLAIGASHYWDELPNPDRFDQSPLAAFNVKTSHLKKGLHRKAESLHCVDAISIKHKNVGSAVIRLFSPKRRNSA